jgi:hypothetical protein
MLVGKQVALFVYWLAEAKCRAKSTVPHVLKGRPNAIYNFTVSCEVLRTPIICRPFRKANCLSQLKKAPATLIITQQIDEQLFFDITFKNSAFSVHTLPTFHPTWITIPKVKTSTKPIAPC